MIKVYSTLRKRLLPLHVGMWFLQVLIMVKSFIKIGGFDRLPFADDFAHYYLSAKLFWNHHMVYGIPFHMQPAKLYSAARIREATNPPVLIMLTSPLAAFSIKNAYLLWIVFLIGSFEVSLLCLSKYMKLNTRITLLANLAILISSPFLSDMRFAQIEPLLVALLIFSFILFSERREVSSAVLFGFLSSIKFLTLPLLLFFVGRKNIKFVVISTLSFVIFVGLSQIPKSLNLATYYNHAEPIIQIWMLNTTVNQSLPSVLSHLVLMIVGYNYFSASSYFVMTKIISIVTMFLGACIIVVLGATSQKQGDYTERLEIYFAAACIVNLFASPLAWPHYFLFLVLPLFLLCKNIRSRDQVTFICVMIFLSFPLWPILLDTLKDRNIYERLILGFLCYAPSLFNLMWFVVLWVLAVKNLALHSTTSWTSCYQRPDPCYSSNLS